jgi:hypothetical protein
LAYTTPRTWVAGEYPTAAQFNANIRDNLNAAFPLAVGAWTAFTPTVKLGATTVSIANDSRYQRVGRLVVATFVWRFTNLNGGTGTLTATLPVARRVSLTNDYAHSPGPGGFIDVSTANVYSLFVHFNDAAGTDCHFRTPASPSVVVTHAAPFAIAVGASGTGDEFYGTATYEAAT